MERFSQLDDLVPDVIQDVAECPVSAVKHALRHVLNEFLADSKAWKEVVTGDLTADSDTVTLDLTGYAGYVELVYNVKLKGVTTDEFADLMAIRPAYYHCSPEGVITLQSSIIPSETITDGLQAQLALVNDIHSSVCPAEIIRDACRVLIPKAQAFLLDTIGRPYSNPDFAIKRMAKSNDEMVKYKNKIDRRRTNSNRGFRG